MSLRLREGDLSARTAWHEFTERSVSLPTPQVQVAGDDGWWGGEPEKW